MDKRVMRIQHDVIIADGERSFLHRYEINMV